MKHFRKIRTAACAFVLSASFLLPATGSSFVAYADEKSEIEEIKKKNEERERKKAAAQDKLNSLNIEANKIYFRTGSGNMCGSGKYKGADCVP